MPFSVFTMKLLGSSYRFIATTGFQVLLSSMLTFHQCEGLSLVLNVGDNTWLDSVDSCVIVQCNFHHLFLVLS